MSLLEFRTGLRGFEARIAGDLPRHCLGVRHDSSRALSDVEDPFYSEDPRRTWVFESMLREPLPLRFGNRWSQARRDGRFSKKNWKTGQLCTADELSREIGLGPIELHLLTAALREGLSL